MVASKYPQKVEISKRRWRSIGTVPTVYIDYKVVQDCRATFGFSEGGDSLLEQLGSLEADHF